MSERLDAATLVAAAADRARLRAEADRLTAQSEQAAADADRLAREAAEALRIVAIAERVTDVVDGQPLECIVEYAGSAHERVRVVNLVDPMRYATYTTTAPHLLTCYAGTFSERPEPVDQPDAATARASAIAWVLPA